MAEPAHPAVSGTLPRIQRFAGQPTGAAPASVDQALANPGTPLEPALRQDMEQRFGCDFSRVRVHTGAVAEQSALEVNANAYTVGHNIIFGAGLFAPGTHEGRRLIAHELTHVVQQSGSEGTHFCQNRVSGRRMPAITPTGRKLARAPGDEIKGPPPRIGGLTRAEWVRIAAARNFFNLPPRPTSSQSTIVGVLITEAGEEIFLKSGGEGGPSGGTQRGHIPRGRGESFTGGGSSQGNIATHVEGHAAAVMHQRNISQATLLIEAAPCKVCDNPTGTANLTRALPPGSKLTVVDPETTGHYWSSQRPGSGTAPAAPVTPPPAAATGDFCNSDCVSAGEPRDKGQKSGPGRIAHGRWLGLGPYS